MSSLEGKKIVLVGDMMLGDMDTIRDWNLIRNINRFASARDGTKFGVHTVDAHMQGRRLHYGESLCVLLWLNEDADFGIRY